MSGMKRAGQKTGNSPLANQFNNDLMYRVKKTLGSSDLANAQRQLNKALQYAKWMTLARLDRPINEYTWNGLRAFAAEGVTPLDYRGASNEAYSELISAGTSESKFSQYQEEIGETQINESKLKNAARSLVTFADSQIGRLVFKKVFDRQFKELSGNKFDADKFNSDANYRKEHFDDLTKARVNALSRVEELFNSKTAIGSPSFVSFFGKNLEKDHFYAQMLYYMQSFNHNELNQVKSSLYRINKGNKQQKLKGARDIAAILASNYGYIQTSLLINQMYKALMKDVVDDDDKSSVKDALDQYVDENYKGEAIMTSVTGSLMNLSTGKNAYAAKWISKILLGGVEVMGKQQGTNKEE